MAKPNMKVLVEITGDLSHPISVWIDNPKEVMDDIARIEGVSDVHLPVANDHLQVRVNKRYDTQEVAEEILSLSLLADEVEGE